MVHLQLIHKVVEFEKRLEWEEEARINRQPEPYVNYLAVPQPAQDAKQVIPAAIFEQRRSSQPVSCVNPQVHCR